MDEETERRRYLWKCGIPHELCTTGWCDGCGRKGVQGIASITNGRFLCLDCASKEVVKDPPGKHLDVEDFARV